MECYESFVLIGLFLLKGRTLKQKQRRASGGSGWFPRGCWAEVLELGPICPTGLTGWLDFASVPALLLPVAPEGFPPTSCAHCRPECLWEWETVECEES